MAKCELCNKQTSFGVSVSHSRSHVSGRYNRKVKPNLKKATIVMNNQLKRVTVCTRCLRMLQKTNRPRQ